MAAKICLCLTGKTLSRDLELIKKNRKYIDVAELRVDCLDPDERFFIRNFPEQADVPVILSIRRKKDGGWFEGGESSRIALLSRGLAFAETDKRHNYAYVDLEEDLEVPGLEEAVRTFGTRIIRSAYNLDKMGDITEKIKDLRRIGDEIAKVVVMPQNLGDVLAIYRAGRENLGVEKIILGRGSFGVNTRILAEHLGSFLSYTSAIEEPDIIPGGLGQISPREMVEWYRFRELNAATDIYGIVGFPLTTSYSHKIFNTVFHHEKINAVYVTFPALRLDNFLELADELNMKGASVTIPYREEIIPFLNGVSDSVRIVGACNTIKADDAEGNRRFIGDNTDTLGFSESLLHFMSRKNLRGLKVTVIGAGGAAKAVVSEIHRLKGKCLILNRNAVRARELALNYGCKWGGLDSHALDTMERYSDIIIQTTPAGSSPNTKDDPFELYNFNGHETVMDLIYNPPLTAFLKRAQAAGCSIFNGFDMLIRQAKYQYEYFFERDFPEQLVTRLTGMLQNE